MSMAQQYRHKNHSVSLVNFHFVWIPKRSRPVLVNQVEQRLRDLVYEIAKDLQCIVISLEVLPDHVHLLLNCPPEIAAHQIMHRIKGATSRCLRKEFPHLLKLPSLWTRSYFVSTAGNLSSETIRKYIEAQKSHGT